MRARLVGIIGGLLAGFGALLALAHTNTSPTTMPTFSNGQVLTATNLNNAFDHLHYTLSGNITNDNISPSAAISQSKIAGVFARASAVITVAPAYDGGEPAATFTGQNVASISRVAGNQNQLEVVLSSCPSDMTKVIVSYVRLEPSYNADSSPVMCRTLVANPQESCTFRFSCHEDTGAVVVNTAIAYLQFVAFWE